MTGYPWSAGETLTAGDLNAAIAGASIWRAGLVTTIGTNLTLTGGVLSAAAAAGVTSFNGRSAVVTLLSADVTGALTYTPAPTASPTFTGTVTAGAINVGAFTATGITATPISGSTGSFTTLAASSTVSGAGFTTLLTPYALLASPTFTGTVTAGTTNVGAFTATGITGSPISGSTGSFTTLAASSTVSGTGFSNYLASPPAIGGSAAAAGSFTTLSGSVTATGSTTARTLADRAADVIRAVDYGVVADGTTDNTTAMNAAITAASVQAYEGTIRRLVLPSGIIITQPLTLAGQLEMWGEHSAGTILRAKTGSTSPVITIQSAGTATPAGAPYDTVALRYLRIESADFKTGNAGVHGISFVNGTRTVTAILDNVTIYGVSGNAINASSVTGSLDAWDVMLYNNAGTGVNVSSCNDWHFYGGQIGTNGVDGVLLSDCAQCVFHGINIYSNGSHNLRLFSTAGGSAGNLQFTDCMFDRGVQIGVTYDMRGLTGAVFKGCTFGRCSTGTPNTYSDVLVGSSANNLAVFSACFWGDNYAHDPTRTEKYALEMQGGTQTVFIDGANTFLTGVLRTNAAQSQLTAAGGTGGALVNGAAATARTLGFTTAGALRWNLRGASATVESGSNAGSNWALDAYADDGTTLLSTPFSIARSTGLVTMNVGAAITGLTVSSGAGFGSTLASSNSDLSKHVALFSTTYGVSVTSARLNLVAPSAASVVVALGGTDVASVTSTGLNACAIGATTASTGAFTTLSASSTVSGTGFSTYLASPPAIGGSAAAAGSFTTLSASSTVSGTGFSTYLASPPAIGGSAAAAGSFTTLSASSTVSGTGFSAYLASPPAIGGTAAAAGTFTALTVSTSGQFNTDLFVGANGSAKNLWANGPAASFRSHVFATAGTARWNISCDSTAESGANAGSDLQFRNYNDAGSNIATPLKIVRSTGVVQLATGVAISGTSTIDAATIGGTTPAAGTFTSVKCGSTSGPTWTTGTGAPSSTQPVGSMFSRTDGGIGTTLYVSSGGGSWNAVAGV